MADEQVSLLEVADDELAAGLMLWYVIKTEGKTGKGLITTQVYSHAMGVIQEALLQGLKVTAQLRELDYGIEDE